MVSLELFLVIVAVNVLTFGVAALAYRLGVAHGRLREIEEREDDGYQPAPSGGHLIETSRPRWL